MDTDIVQRYRTDHSGIISKMKLHELERRKTYWMDGWIFCL